ncbi:hypothetical protein [Clostridium estertheticum]|nr:hypothetical protein [Clostridium estertheticum]
MVTFANSINSYGNDIKIKNGGFTRKLMQNLQKRLDYISKRQ